MIWILAIISAILYRTGGASREEIPFANSQYRDTGCPILVLIALLMAGMTWYLAFASALLVLVLIRTYWDSCLGGTDSMFAHGFGLGLCMIPLHWSGVAWWQIGAYTLILSVSYGILNWFVNKFQIPFRVWIEECFRGFALIALLQLFKILNNLIHALTTV